MYIPVPMHDEHASMASTVTQLLERHVDIADVRSVLDVGDDGLAGSEAWRRATAIGLPGVTVPEDFEGMGASPLDTFVAFRAWGRTPHPSPLLSSIGMAAPALVHAASAEAKLHYLPLLAEGETLATLAVAEDTECWDLDGVHCAAVRSDGSGWRLSGRKTFVLDVPSADVVLIVARAEFGLGLFAVERGARGLTVEALTGLDLTRTVSHLDLSDVEAQLVSDEADATPLLQRARQITDLCLVADSVGGAEACLEAAVSYAKVREQFGRPIGSFQAVKHKLADLAVTVEGMVSTGWTAAESLETQAVDAEIDLLVAKVVCGPAYFQVARANIQVHGGIGFTWEHPAHLYFRRAMTNAKLLGDLGSDRDELYRRSVESIDAAGPQGGA